MGTIYLLHFDRPYRHARHYCGWTENLPARLDAHRDGRGARLITVITAAGIGWTLARTWDGGRARERQIKRQGGGSRICPLCGIHPRLVLAEPTLTLLQRSQLEAALWRILPRNVTYEQINQALTAADGYAHYIARVADMRRAELLKESPS